MTFRDERLPGFLARFMQRREVEKYFFCQPKSMLLITNVGNGYKHIVVLLEECLHSTGEMIVASCGETKLRPSQVIAI